MPHKIGQIRCVAQRLTLLWVNLHLFTKCYLASCGGILTICVCWRIAPCSVSLWLLLQCVVMWIANCFFFCFLVFVPFRPKIILAATFEHTSQEDFKLQRGMTAEWQHDKRETTKCKWVIRYSYNNKMYMFKCLYTCVYLVLCRQNTVNKGSVLGSVVLIEDNIYHTWL